LQFKAVKPVGDRVLVKVDQEEAKSTGGVLLPTVAQTKQTAGSIVAAGDVNLVKVSVQSFCKNVCIYICMLLACYQQWQQQHQQQQQQHAVSTEMLAICCNGIKLLFCIIHVHSTGQTR
jgi:co-chaperonin GroES (HSP10)